MKSQRGALSVVTAALVALGALLWGAFTSEASRAATSGADPQVINRVTGDAFAPAPDGSPPSGALSATQAVAAFEKQDPDFNPPSPVSYQAGYFFPGPGESQGPADRAVWALAWHECPVSHDPTVKKLIDGGVCTRWLFLDAYTGDMIVSEYQIPAKGSARGANGASTRCKPGSGEVVTLRLKAPVQTVRADVGDTIKVVVSIPGGHVNSPHPDSGQAVCRISTHRVSPSKVIATFRAQRPKTRVTFRAAGETSSKGCPPRSHGCPRPTSRIGYLKINH